MAVGLSEPVLLPVPGVRMAATSAGIYRKTRADLCAIELAAGGTAAAMFTTNAFCAAPVIVARHHLKQVPPRYCLVNAGNANAGTGAAGIAAAERSCAALAALTGCDASAVLPFSTGVIGEHLPVDRIVAALPTLLGSLREDAWMECARAIMTTDTVPKGRSVTLQLQDRTVTVTGMAKGAGMIHPDMATMLAFVATDAAVDSLVLQRLLAAAVESSFNRITVDGDTSTNDACVVLASGAAGNAVVREADTVDGQALGTALREVCTGLAQAVVRDGEGATKFITVTVSGGGNETECLRVCHAVATSPLVKTAFFASDPNWGRILAATGRSGIQGLDVSRVQIHLDEICIVDGGARAPQYTEVAGRQVMDRSDITVWIDLGRGTAHASVWTCDFSTDYVRINADYRS